jgi:hypothetical protein
MNSLAGKRILFCDEDHHITGATVEMLPGTPEIVMAATLKEAFDALAEKKIDAVVTRQILAEGQWPKNIPFAKGYEGITLANLIAGSKARDELPILKENENIPVIVWGGRGNPSARMPIPENCILHSGAILPSKLGRELIKAIDGQNNKSMKR